MGSLPPLQDRLAGVAFAPKNFLRQAFTAGQTLTVQTPAAGKQIFVGMIHVTALAATVVTVKIGSQVIYELDLNGSELFGDAFIPLGQVLYNPTMANDEVLSIASSAATSVGATFLIAQG
jgi:hypothetical protein